MSEKLKNIFCYTFIIMILFPVSIYAAQDKLFLKSGEILNGHISNSSFSFSTNYGNLEIPPTYVISIEFSDRDCKITTIYNEYITAQYKNQFVTLDTGGGILNIQKEHLKRIYISNRTDKKKDYYSYFEMKNSDKLYGEILNTVFKLTTTYGTVDINFTNIMKIEDIEGQTKVYLQNSNIMQGFIASPFLSIRLNYGPKLEIPKSSIKIVDVQQ